MTLQANYRVVGVQDLPSVMVTLARSSAEVDQDDYPTQNCALHSAKERVGDYKMNDH